MLDGKKGVKMGEDEKISREIVALSERINVFPFRANGMGQSPQTTLRHLKLIEAHINRLSEENSEQKITNLKPFL